MILGAWGLGRKRLPYDAEVEYLEPTGTQWIDIPTNGVAGKYYSVEGHITADTIANKVFFDTNTLNQFLSRGYSSSSDSQTFTSTVGNSSTSGGWYVYTGVQTQFKVSTTGVTIYGVFYPLSRSLTSNFSIFRLFAKLSQTFNYAPMSQLKLHDLQIYSDASLEHDFVPVRVGSGANAVGYLYDRVSGELFGNAGSGAFIVGPDK